MTVYVDQLVEYPRRPYGHRHWAHLWTDGDPAELHALAARIGLRRAWYQDSRTFPHYDVTASKRPAALKAGAVAGGLRELEAAIAARRQSRTGAVEAAERAAAGTLAQNESDPEEDKMPIIPPTPLPRPRPVPQPDGPETVTPLPRLEPHHPQDTANTTAGRASGTGGGWAVTAKGRPAVSNGD